MAFNSAARRSWVKHYSEETGNISATCRHFGISRATFYKWLNRYDPSKPSKPLLSRSRRPHTKRVSTRSPMDIEILAELGMRNPRWGAGRLASKMQEHGIAVSRATVGRMLFQIRRRCPLCHMAEVHNPGLHALHRDLSTIRLRGEEERASREFALQGLSS